MTRLLALLKFFSALLAAAAVMLLALTGFARLMRPDPRRPLPDYPAEEVAKVLKARNTSFDPANTPRLQVEVDYTEGPSAAWYPKGESPVLAELVAEGKLPPVAERLGPEPVVIRGVDGIGTYGGSLQRVVVSEGDVGIMGWRIGSARFARWSPLGYPIVPHLARGWSSSEDGKTHTVYLRRGLRWSDGHPFTTRDIEYFWKDEVQHFKLKPPYLAVFGQQGHVEIVDDYTARFHYPMAQTEFAEILARYLLWAPAHYLRQFHPKHGDPEKIAALMAGTGSPSPRTAYFRLRSWRNPDMPTLDPWIARSYQASPPYVFVRNPYYGAVDPEGNQLPYLDRVVNTLRSQDMLAVTAAAGDITMQMRHLRYEDQTLFLSNREAGNYDLYYWFRGERSNFAIFPNLNRAVEPDKPETRWKKEFLNQVDFRKALSLAINRREIIRAEYDENVKPAQLDPGPESPYHHPPLFHAYTEYDPAEANRLLDAIGLDQRDQEGYRQFPDGTRMTFFLHVTELSGPGPSHFLVEQWGRVGVRVILRYTSRGLWHLQQSALTHDLSVWIGESEYLPLIEPRSFVPTWPQAFYATGFAAWFAKGGILGVEVDPEGGKAIEPPLDHPIRRSMEVYRDAKLEPDPEARREIFREALEIAAENLWTLNIATPPPQIVLVKRGLRNVPRNAITGHIFSTPANAGMENYFLTDPPSESPAIRESLKESMVEVIPDPRIRGALLEATLAAPPSSAAQAFSTLLRWLFRLVALLFAVLILIRHPFVLRRLIILIPTIVLMSICIYVIMELPPGDFITSRIQQLELDGEEAALQQAIELRALFHMDDPSYIRYLRWTGLPWFLSFDDADRGLLQGDLGRSMENGQRVNEIVGDRILLTMLISFFTILFTWAMAIPIGLYSAVRQYSIGDYIFTFIGFIGMCVPNMLLALLMMYVGSSVFGLSVGGLFSPEFAMQPEWDWPKFVDLLQHIWIPVVVLGVSGTAGMIRVLRANLLDELGKPYVTTARAKGVRPVKLILKYPLRLALNPFISGIGSIFPALISGGAIVGIVLSLPTVGPLMLSALQAQNMYLAGSMLMVLSLLTVLGTLFSDLLLMWVDPRIRIGSGGGK